MTKPRDEQHFTGVRVSVEGVAPLPPDNPPRLDDVTEAAIADYYTAVIDHEDRNFVDATDEAMSEERVESARNALRARIAELLEETSDRAADLWDDEVKHLRTLSLTPEEADHIEHALGNRFERSTRPELFAKLRRIAASPSLSSEQK